MDKELDLFCWIKFVVLEMRPAYLIVLEILLDNIAVPILKMQVSLALQVNVLLIVTDHCAIILPIFINMQCAMMETSGWLEVDTPMKVVWNSVMVVCGALSVAICGI